MQGKAREQKAILVHTATVSNLMFELKVKFNNSNGRSAAEFSGCSITFLVLLGAEIGAVEYANGLEI
jgi:hypothetical protein